MQTNSSPTYEWQITEPAYVGMNQEKLAILEQRIISHYQNINGFVIIRNGLLVFEKYFNGFKPNDTCHVASVTKSIVSALIGIAIDKGLIDDVNQKVLVFFPEYIAGVNDFQKRSITIKHLLTMSAPFNWKTTNKQTNEPLDRLRRQKDWVTYILNLLGQNGQTGRFQYCTAGVHLLSVILTRATGKSVRDFANENLFRPIGMNIILDQEMRSFFLEDVFGDNLKGWIKDPAGYNVGGWGLSLSASDMARFGLLYLNRGFWNGKQIISQNWIDDSVSLNSNNYGYLWWLRNEKDLFSYSALGSGGNVICCIPNKKLVVSIASSIIAKPRDRWLLIEDYILPSIKE